MIREEIEDKMIATQKENDEQKATAEDDGP